MNTNKIFIALLFLFPTVQRLIVNLIIYMLGNSSNRYCKIIFKINFVKFNNFKLIKSAFLVHVTKVIFIIDVIFDFFYKFFNCQVFRNFWRLVNNFLSKKWLIQEFFDITGKTYTLVLSLDLAIA